MIGGPEHALAALASPSKLSRHLGTPHEFTGPSCRRASASADCVPMPRHAPSIRWRSGFLAWRCWRFLDSLCFHGKLMVPYHIHGPSIAQIQHVHTWRVWSFAVSFSSPHLCVHPELAPAPVGLGVSRWKSRAMLKRKEHEHHGPG